MTGSPTLPDPTERFRSESAGQHVVTRVPVAQEGETAGEVVRRLAGGGHEGLEAVFIVDDARRFVGAIRLPDLYQASEGSAVAAAMDRSYPRVALHHDQEQVAEEALRRRASSVAVVDDGGRLVGAVPALALLDILRREHVEDLHRLAGMQRERARDRTAMEAPPLRRARHRLPWLLVGLAGSMLSAVVASRFEHVLSRQVSVAFFIPAIVYLADAIGTQTEAIVVRGLSLSRLPLRHLLFDELRTGLLIGVTLAALALPLVAATFGDLRLALSVAIAITVAGGVATTIGLLLPWLIHRAGSDPAFGSGPVATIVQDLLSLLIYFAVATWIMV